MLFNEPDASHPDMEIELRPEENRFGDVWQVHVQEARAGQFYLYRLDEATI